MINQPIQVITLNEILTIISLIVGVISIALAIIFFFFASSSSKKIEEASNKAENSLKEIETLINLFYKDTFYMVKDITGDMTKFFISLKLRRSSK